MSVTIKMIAEKCGVSRGTVDRVLNHRGRVSEETVKKVNEAVKELGYKPNALGKALALQRKQQKIGVILCSVGNDFYDEMLEGFKASEEENGKYQIEVLYRFMKGYDVDRQIQLMEELEDKVQCLIITAIDDMKIAKKIDQYMDAGIGVFTLNTDISSSKRIAHVGVNVLECGRIACGLIGMLCHGEGKVLIAAGSLSLLEHCNRVLGFCTTMEERYPGIKLAKIIETQDDNEEAYQKTKEFLMDNKDIQAIFIGGGGAEGICRAVKEEKMDSLWIVACDIVPVIRQLMKEKWIQAAIDQQPWMQGYQALNLAVHYLVEGATEPNYIIKNEIKLYENI